MAVLQVDDIVSVAFVGTLCSQRTLTTLYYRVAAVPSNTQDLDAFAALVSSLKLTAGAYTKYVNAVPTNWVQNSIWCQIIRPIRYRKITFAQVGGGNGPGNAYTANVQGSVTRLGALAKRTNVGGIRVPIGTGENCVNNGALTEEQLNDLAALGGAMKLNVITASPVVTFTPLATLSKPGGLLVPMIDYIAQPTARVLRRRTVGLGE